MKKILLALLLLVALIIGGVMTVGPSIVDRSLNRVSDHQPYVVSDQAKILHKELFIGDWHADTLMWNRDLGKHYDYGHIDLRRLQQGNVSLQMFTTVTQSPSNLNYHNNSADTADDMTRLIIAQRWPISTWTDLTQRALYQARKLHDFARENANELMIVTSQSELASFLQRKRDNPALVGGLIGTEGSHALSGELENVNTLFDAGFRMMSLHHFFDNKLGGSLHGINKGGLSEFGRQVIRRMESLGVILDVSHSSEQVVQDTLDFATRPMVVSHTGFRGYCNTRRNISDSLIKEIAAKGGLIAVGYWDGAVCGNSPSDIVGAMKFGLELVGEDHLSLGSDFDGSVTTGFDSSEMSALTSEMMSSGFTEEQIRKIMGGNMLRFLQTYLPG